MMVPVLSKQQTSTRPANGMRNGSVQKMAEIALVNTTDSGPEFRYNSPNLLRATKLAFTARLNSIGNSGGTTLVMIKTQSRRSLYFFNPLSRPFVQTYQLAAMAKIRRNPMKRKDSKLLAVTRSVEKIMVRTSWPWAVPNPVRTTTPRHPPSGVLMGEGISAAWKVSWKWH